MRNKNRTSQIFQNAQGTPVDGPGFLIFDTNQQPEDDRRFDNWFNTALNNSNKPIPYTHYWGKVDKAVVDQYVRDNPDAIVTEVKNLRVVRQGEQSAYAERWKSWGFDGVFKDGRSKGCDPSRVYFEPAAA